MLNVFDSQQAAIGRSQTARQCAIIYVNPYAHLFTLEDWVSFAIMSVYLCFIMLNMFNSQQAAVGRSQAARQHAIIYVNLYAHFFMLKDRVSSTIMPVYLCFIMLNMFNSQQAAIGWLQAPCRHLIIYVNPYTHLFTLEDRVGSVIASVRHFANFGMVIFSVHLQQNPSITVNVMNSYLTLDKVNLTIGFNIIICYLAPDWVNLTIAPDAMTRYLTPDGVNWTIAPDAMTCYLTPDGVNWIIAPDAMTCYLIPGGVNWTIAPDVMTCYLTHDGVNLTITPDVMACYLTHDEVNLTITPDVMGVNLTIAPDAMSYLTSDGVNFTTPGWHANSLPLCVQGVLPMMISQSFVKSCILVQRDQTALYDVAEYPFFLLHSKQSDLFGFGETFKIYAYHLAQYRLAYVVEFIFHWSNHICYFVSQNMWMLINFDLTPQQHCQRAYLTMCQSLYYKHDFAIISTVNGLSANYVVAGFVKYYENILCLIFKLRDCYKMHTTSSTKRGSTIQISNLVESIEHKVPNKIGGGQHGASIEKIGMEVISPFVISMPVNYSDIKMCEFVEHLEMSKGLKNYSSSNHVFCNVPLHLLATCLFQNSRTSIGHKHDIHILKTMTKPEIIKLFKIHDDACEHKYVTVFRPYQKISSSKRGLRYCETQNPPVKNDSAVKPPEVQKVDVPAYETFPPAPPDPSLRKKIINGFCDATGPSRFEEAGCAVCGALTLQTELSDLHSLSIDLSVLNTAGLGFTRKERKDSAEPISELDGPAIDTSCHYICISCKDKVRHGKIPKFALARGLWLGKIPDELQQLSFAEKLLIGRVRHNRCVVRVAKGMHKMISNAVTFEHPMQNIYTILPPPIEEMDEVLAFIFTGPCQPTEDDFCRTPLLVRRNKVAKALEWLKFNHRDYADLEISYKNLESYPEDSPPVVVNY